MFSDSTGFSGFGVKHLALGISAVVAASQGAAVMASDEVFAIEEIVVTAQKRQQSAQDIGVSVTAMGGDDIKNLGITEPKDIAAFTPGLSSTNATSGGTPIFAIRGIGLDDFNINNNSGVGVYFDEVFASNPAMLSSALLDMERVEVLKGPQGTLYGKNTTGGAINYISRKPTEALDGYITAGYGSWDTTDLKGAIGGALSDDVKGRVAFSYTDQQEGWQEDKATGEEFGKQDSLAIRGLLAINITDDVSALLNVHYAKDDSTPVSPQGTDPFGFSGPVDLPDDVTEVNVGALDVKREDEGYGFSLNLTAEFDTLTLTSITAWDAFEHQGVDNYNGFSNATFDFVQDDEVEQFSQEVRLTSDNEGNFNWILGLSYSFDEVDVKDASDVTDTGFYNWSDPSIAAVNAADYNQETESYGVYLHTETALTDRMMLNVGLRYSYDERSFDGVTTDVYGAPNSPFTGVVGGVIAQLDETHNEDDLSYRIGLDFDLTEDVLLYANVATGYKMGSFYGSPAFAQEIWAYSKPEEVFSYELGIKSQLMDNRLRINASMFHYDYDDRQSLLLAFDGPIFAAGLDNLEESDIDGAELEVTWLPLEGLDLRVGVGYLDADTGSEKTDLRGLSLFSNFPEGSPLSQSPEWSYNAIASYEVSVSDSLMGRVQFAYSWQDDQAAQLADPQATYGPVESLDARVSVGDSNDQWEVALWGRNITDENSETYAFTNFLGGRTVYHQRPASYGVEVTYNFF